MFQSNINFPFSFPFLPSDIKCIHSLSPQIFWLRHRNPSPHHQCCYLTMCNSPAEKLLTSGISTRNRNGERDWSWEVFKAHLHNGSKKEGEESNDAIGVWTCKDAVQGEESLLSELHNYRRNNLMNTKLLI